MGRGTEQEDQGHQLQRPLDEVEGAGVGDWAHAVQHGEANESRETDVGGHVLPVGEGKLYSVVDEPVEEGNKESVATG